MPDNSEELRKDAETVKGQARRLISLLEDQGGFGMATWMMAVSGLIQDINITWHGPEVPRK
jgi:hypothetical protein